MPEDHGIDGEQVLIFFLFKFTIINMLFINNYVEKNSRNCG